MTKSHHLRSAVVAAITTFISLPTLVLAAPPASAADTNPPTPPSDVVGRSSSSNVLRADDLAVSSTGSDGTTTAGWGTYNTDLQGFSAQGQAYPTTGRRALTFPNLTSRSGRLIDSQSDRVLSLQRVAVGDGASWQLSSPDGAMETAAWQGKDTDHASQVSAGQTYALRLVDTTTGLSGATDSGDDANQLQTVKADTSAMTQQWSLRAAGDGAYRLVNRSDGLCLNVLGAQTNQGSPVGAWPCPDTTTSGNEEWTFQSAGSDGGGASFGLKGVQSGRFLEVNEQGALELGSTDGPRLSDEQWTLTSIYDPAAAVPTWSTPASTVPGMPAALTTGDLDRSVGANGQYGDEAAVAFVDDEHRLQVRVLDYNASADHFTVSTPDAALPEVGVTVGDTWYTGSVGLAIGNFTGQTTESVADPDNPDVQDTKLVRNNQLAVTWQDDKGFNVAFLDYSATQGGGRQLAVTGSESLPRSSSSVDSKPTLTALAGMAQTAVGDFNGDDVDDLAVSYGAADSLDKSTGTYSGTTAWVKIVTLTDDLTLDTNADQQFDGRALLLPSPGSTFTRRGVSLTAGLFDLGASGSGIRDRQIAASWTDSGKFIRAQLADLNSTGGVHLFGDTDQSLGGNVSVDHPVSLAAGGYAGLGDGGTFPAWGLVLASDSCLRMLTLQTSGDLTESNAVCNGTQDLSVTAFDRSGRSLLLGAPAVLTADQMVKPFLIAAQPPTHADWLTDPTTGAGRFINVSRTGEFKVEMGNDTDNGTTSTRTKKSSTSLGISEASDSKTTVKGGLGSLESASETIDFGQKFDTEADQEKQNTTTYKSSRSTTTSQTTAGDDIVDATTETDTIYRYPILSGALTGADGKPVTSQAWCPTTCYGFYEVTLPGKTVATDGNGKADSWYQPDWQNGNALSYPPLVNGDLALTDQGSYSYNDPDNGGKPTEVNADIADTPVLQLGGAPFTQTMTIQDGASSDTDRTASGSMTNSQEAQSSTKLHGSIGVASASEDIDISAGVQEGSTWADTTTSTNDVTSTSDFTLEAPEVSSNEGYNVVSKYYVDKAGTPKVVHGVDLTSNAAGAKWWRTNYSKPDLALNLNDAITMGLNSAETVRDVPQWTADDSRQLIRGFYVLQPDDPSSPTTSGQPYANNPAPGDPVRFAVRLHNYSLSQAPASSAQFYAVPMEADGSTLAGDPVAVGGTIATPRLDAQGVATITSNPWTAVGPSDGTGSQNWRIFVVLDPDGSVDETHPWKGGPACPASDIDQSEGYDTNVLTDPMTGQDETLACGQNNQGYGEVTITAPSDRQEVDAAATRLRIAPSKIGASRLEGRQTASREDEDYLTLNRTTLLNNRDVPVRTRHGVQQVVVEESVRGLVHASSAIHSSEQQNVLVYDGKPGKGQLISHSRMAGADADQGGTASFTWRPSKPGRHVITAVLLTTHGQDKVQKTVVNVRPHGRATGLSLSPARTTTAPDVPVQFDASTVDAHGNRIKDVTATTRLTISPDGTCRKTRCSAEIVGDHTVTAQHAGYTATATMTVAKGKLTLTPTRGTGQQVSAKAAFGPLVAAVTDEAGKPVDRAPVEFAVTSGQASFSRHRSAVTVRTGPAGVVQAPKLTAGPKSGPVVVTATSGDTSTVYALATQKPGRDRADIAISLVGPTSGNAGKALTTEIRITNHGPKTASGTLVEILAPAHARLVQTSPGSQSGRTVLYRLAPLKSGRTRSLKLQWTNEPGKSRLEAVAVSATTDPRSQNNSAAQVVTLDG